ncbi:hypothetical protein ACFZBP_41355 [Streptomyces sp. NPDC008086]|uniref:hypothetical protein n=1 Tax=Streptomyces sp. NPDC008086 TaxID=3364807 RepID=UPI0036E590CD
MNVLLCATRGTRLTEPARRLDETPAYPGWDGLPGPDPLPVGAPFEPIGPDEDHDGIVPGGMWKSDERGFLVAAGPRGTFVLHPDDAVGLTPHPDPYRLIGCCGPDGTAGVNHVCGCGAEVAVGADRTSGYETRLVPDAVRVEAAA